MAGFYEQISAFSRYCYSTSLAMVLTLLFFPPLGISGLLLGLKEVLCSVGDMLLLSQLLTIPPCFRHELTPVLPSLSPSIPPFCSQRYLVPPVSQPLKILPC